MFVLLTLAVVLLGGLLLFNSGVAVSEKMRLQNAADATAYSVSQLEARDLNFTAYLNRAMVAHEVAIAQMIGLASWSAYLSTVPDYLEFYLRPVIDALVAASLGILSPLTAIFTTIINTARTVTRAIRRVMGRIAGLVTGVLSGMNFAYSAAQLGMHTATLVMSIGTIDRLVKKNAPGAKVSDFGIFALAGHMATHYAISPLGFVRSYRQNSTSPSQQAGMQRFAATVQESRDPFSERREGSPWNDTDDPGWTVPLFPPIHEELEGPEVLGVTSFLVRFDFELGIARRGGTELRYRERRRRQLYNWTAADTLSLIMDLGLHIEIAEITFVDISTGEIGPAFGVGGAMAAKAGQGPKARGMLPDVIGGTIPGEAYGKAAENPIAWTAAPYLQYAVPRWWRSNNVGRRYPGLPRHNAVAPGTNVLGFQSPRLIIGLVKEDEDVSFHEGRGQFRLDGAAADDELGVIAKSEVYFSRPTDLSYFVREDGLEEYANSFNPFWQARLVEANFADRTIALLIQQGEFWDPTLSMPNIPTPDFDDLLEKAGIR